MHYRRLQETAVAVGLLAALVLPTARAARPVVVVAEQYPPFEYLQDGVPTGIGVDITKRVFAKLGTPVEFRFYPFPRAWMLIEKGRADAVASISYAPNREKILFYTPEQKDFLETGNVPRDHVWLTENVFFVSAALRNALRFESLHQIRDDKYRTGIVANYSYTPKFWEAGLDTVSYPDAPAAFRALIAGGIQVFPFDRTVGLWVLKREGLLDKVSYLPKSIFVKPYALGFSRVSGYPDIESLMHAYYRELAELRFSGEYDSIFAKYLPEGDAWAPPHPLVFVAEPWPPYESLDAEGRVRGINVDVISRVMNRLGIPYSIRLYPWSRAWMMVQKGAADAVLSISYKASREADLAYTDLQRGANGQSGDVLWQSEYVFFAKTRDVERIRFDSLDQLKAEGVVVGVNRDYSYSPEFVQAGLQTVEYTGTQAGFKGLVADDIQLYPMDITVGRAQIAELGLSQSITNLPKVIFSKPYLAVFSKHSRHPRLDEIRPAFYAELDRIRRDAEYQAIVAAHTRAGGI